MSPILKEDFVYPDNDLRPRFRIIFRRNKLVFNPENGELKQFFDVDFLPVNASADLELFKRRIRIDSDPFAINSFGINLLERV